MDTPVAERCRAPMVTSRLPAFAGAAVFAVHPLQSEAVGYVSGRSEVLCAVWFIGALLAARARVSVAKRSAATLAARCARSSRSRRRRPPRRCRWCFCCTTGCFGRAPTSMRRNGSGADRSGCSRCLRLPEPIGYRRCPGDWRIGSAAPPECADAGDRDLALCRPARLAGSASRSCTPSIACHRLPIRWRGSRSPGLVLVVHSRRFDSADRSPVVGCWACSGSSPCSRRRRASSPLREGMAEHRVYLASAGLFMAGASAGLRCSFGGA